MRNSLFLAFLILVTAISCQKETLLSPDSDGDVQCDGKDRITIEQIGLSLDAPQQTKTTLTYTDGKIKSRWMEGDKVLVSDLSSSSEWTVSKTSTTASATTSVFVGSITTSAPDIYAIYPSSEAKLSSGVLSVNLRPQQDAQSQNILDLKAAAIPSSEAGRQNTDFPMANLTSIVKLKLTLPQTLGGVSLEGEKILSFSLMGCGVNLAGDNISLDLKSSRPQLTEASTDVVTYSFPEGVSAVGVHEAMIFVKPSDFSQSGRKLMYKVETDSYNVVFQFTPTAPMSAGIYYPFTFNLSKDTWKAKDNVDLIASDRDYSVSSKQIPVTSTKNTYGTVVDQNGRGIPGVSVSDGYTVVKTNEMGIYEFDAEKASSTKAHGYVFISVPSGYEAVQDGVFPEFWHSFTSNSNSVQERHDFHLTQVNNTNHVLLAMADFHLCNRNALYDKRQFEVFANEINTLADQYRSAGTRVYAIQLGDMTWDLYWDNNQNLAVCCFDLPAYKTYINEKITSGIPFFHAMGNHDYDYTKTGDWETAKPYKRYIGPTYYSFNIGGIHYIILDNVICKNNGTVDGRANSMGVTNEQIEWVKKDVANIPSDMPVVVAMHEQAYSLSSATAGSARSTISNVNNAIGSSHKIHYMTGDTHIINHYGKPADMISENNVGAVCGDWWWTGRLTYKGVLPAFSSLKGQFNFQQGRDGSPAGYMIYTMNGSDIKWQFKGTTLPLTKQFKTYDRNEIEINSSTYPGTGSYVNNINNDAGEYKYRTNISEPGTFESDKSNKTKAYNSKNKVLINVWNYDPSWTITVKEGSNSLSVTNESKIYDPMVLVTYNAGRYAEGSKCTSTFMANNTMYHIFSVKASSASSTLTITVKDGFGNTYTETMTRPKPFTIDWD